MIHLRRLALTALVLGAAVLLGGASGGHGGGAGAPQPRDPTPAANGFSRQAEHACRVMGGEYRRVCMLGRYRCVTRYRDAGRVCRDASDCLGHRCVYQGPNPPPPGPVTGRCAVNTDPCGCFTTVDHGRVAGGMCVD